MSAVLKRLLPRSLFGRTILIVVLPLAIVELVATLFFFESHWERVGRRLALGLAGDIAFVNATLSDYPEPSRRATLLDEARRNLNLDVTLVPGRALPPEMAGPADRSLERTLRAALAERLALPFRVDASSHGENVEVLVLRADGVLRVLTPRKRIASSTTLLFVGWLIGSALVAAGIALLFLRNQMRPIRALAVAADAIGKGRDPGPLKPAGASEVRRASEAFLAMRERIQRQIAQRTEMLAGVSHDLRAPLTRMKLQLAMSAQDEGTASLGTDVAEMESMINAYLSFVRGDGGEEPVPTDLPELLEGIVSDARRQGTRVTLAAERGLRLPLKPTAFRRCLTNLLENAYRAAHEIRITAERRGDAVAIAIDDDGPGIPEAERESVFRPFHRLDKARTPEHGGVGLGLTIARDIVRGHGGDIVLGTSPLGGLRAELRLPL
ncbi:MAG: HAMP domain-containing protein [Alphaproteobacteria bacterium]|nr:HAMP domain-containing protein [Alphaproteobacteria bacterium]